MHRAEHCQNDRIVAAHLCSPLGERSCLYLTARNVIHPIVDRALGVAPTGKRQGQGVFWINREGFFEQFERFGAFFLLKCPDMRHCPHSKVVAAQILRPLAKEESAKALELLEKALAIDPKY